MFEVLRLRTRGKFPLSPVSIGLGVVLPPESTFAMWVGSLLFHGLHRRYQKRDEAIDRPSLLLYRIVDGLVDSFFPILADFDDRIDELEDQIFREASDKQLQEIFQMKRQLVGMRKAVTPQRDAFASLMGGVADLPGLGEEDEHYFRDVYDHLIRISDLIDSYRKAAR